MLSMFQLMNLTSILTSMTLTLGIFISVTASSWFSAWLGLELNLLSFIPMIASTKNSYSSEAALKYFLIQALGSSILLLSASFMILENNIICLTMITSSLLLKMGAAPVHFWFPSVTQGLSWPACILLMTLQKMAPMILLSYIVSNNNVTDIIMMSSMLSSMMGSLTGLNQTLLRKIMAYSSINHMGWMIAAMYISSSLWAIYFISYCVVSTSMILVFQTNQMFHLNQLVLDTSPSLTTKLIISSTLLSLGGLPPFLGFIPKMLVFQALMNSLMLLWTGILLVSTLITLFFYIRMSLTIFTLAAPKMKTEAQKYTSSKPSLFTFINVSFMILPLFFILWI